MLRFGFVWFVKVWFVKVCFGFDYTVRYGVGLVCFRLCLIGFYLVSLVWVKFGS